MKKTFWLIPALLLAACGHKNDSARAVRHYPLSGKIVSLDSAHQTATVDAAAIPNFMDAMTMEYPVPSKSEWQSLKAGDRITATVDVDSDSQYRLSDIRIVSGTR